MSTERNDGAVRLLDAAALGIFAAHVAFRLALRGGEGHWGANLSAHVMVPLAAGVWLVARALDRRWSWRLTGLEIPFAALAGLALFSIFLAPYRLAAFDVAGGLSTAILAAMFAAQRFGPERRGALFALMGAVATVVIAYGVVQYVRLGDLAASPDAQRLLETLDDAGEFQGRMGAREPMSTLGYPNSFAGFLVLSLPFLLGFAFDSKSWLARGLGIAVGAAGAFCLAATGSAGAVVAAVAALAALGIQVVVHRRPAWTRALRAGVGVAGVAVLVLAISGPLSPNRVAARSEAIKIRDVYWDAAARIIAHHPLGVGAGNFEDSYAKYKDERQEETRHAHNDYLQAAAEWGIPGLLALLAVFAVAFGAALKPATPDGPDPAPAEGIAVDVGLAAGLLTAFGLQGTFDDLSTAVALTAVAVGAYRLWLRSARIGHFTRWGLAAGLAGAAVHMLVDFDLWDPGFRHFLFLSFAALALTGPLESPTAARPAWAGAGAAILLAIAVPLGFLVAPRFLEADESEARAAAEEWRGTPERAASAWEEAASANPLDPEPLVRLGLREFNEWLQSGADGDGPEATRRADFATSLLEGALRRRPTSAPIHARLAEIHEAVALRLRARGFDPSSLDAAAAEGHLTAAERHARAAVDLYPTRAYHQYLLGRVLDEAGRADESAAAFREALELSANAKRVPRLALDGLQAALASVKGGGDAEAAAEHYRAWRRRQEARPRFAQQWSFRLRELTPSEKSIVDAPGNSK